MKLSELFKRCLYIPYFQTGKSANYATEIKEGKLYLYFEKSDGENDWKINFDFPAVPYRRMGKTVWFAHRGFLGVWKEIEEKVKDDIFNRKIKGISCVGYSHGAAIAVLCYEYARFNRPDLREDIYGYGFGCPRVIWGEIPDDRWQNFTVIRNIDDAVTHLPPTVLGYKHIGKMLEIGKKGRYTPIDAHRFENILNELEKLDI